LKNTVLDSYAVLAFLFKEEGHDKIFALFEKAIDADKKLLIAAPNWAEVRYMVERKVGATKWAEVRAKLLGLPINIVDADQGLAEMAGALKASHKMSLADCFAAALAKQKKAEIYTGDPEFRSVEPELKIIWL
jgi:predicted nucleic acid-binding protein